MPLSEGFAAKIRALEKDGNVRLLVCVFQGRDTEAGAAALDALCRMGDGAAVARCQMLESADELVSVRVGSARVLGKLGGDQALWKLRYVTKSGLCPQVREAAQEAATKTVLEQAELLCSGIDSTSSG